MPDLSLKMEEINVKNILFYAINGIGLGHLTRLLSIARKIKQLENSFNPIFLTSSEACHVLYKHGISYFKLPSKSIARESNIAVEDLSYMYQNTVINLFNTFRPKIFVVDTFPIGSMDDLLGVLGGKVNTKKVYVHREQRPEKMTKARVSLQGFYDLIVTPHVENTAVIPVPKNKKLFWAGNIMVRTRDEIYSKQKTIDILGLPQDKKLVYLSLGGGGDPTDNDCYTRVMNILSHRKDLHMIVSKAPLCKQTFYKRENMTIIDWYPMIEHMNAFDIAISGTGYNTFHELMYCGVPTIFIPKNRTHDDQEKRAMIAESNSAGYCLYENQIEKDLMFYVSQLLDNLQMFSNNAMKLVPQNGAENAAVEIISLVDNGKLKLSRQMGGG